MMKILHVTPNYYPATYWGGPIFSVYALNNALACSPDVSLKVLSTDSAGPSLSERLNRSELKGLYPNQEVLVMRRIAGACISSELLHKLPSMVRWADVVHLTATYSFPTIPTLIACRILGKPLVWSPRGAILDAHEWEGSRRKKLKRLWEIFCNAMLLSGMDITHVTSERERQVTQARIPNAKAVIVPNGVDIPPEFPERDWLPNGCLRLMYLGRLTPKKGIENLLQALKQLNVPKAVLTIYGDGDAGYSAHLKSLAEQLGLLGTVVSFAGQVNGEAKRTAFHLADVCVVPSYTENFCMVVAEALAHGVPVIASQGTPWNRIEEKQCGLWVKNNPESLAKAISQIRLLCLQEMGQRGRRWMEKEFSWDALARKMMETYRSLLR
jgi:glycosyltransferase involved in cell wall biosynthesis